MSLCEKRATAPFQTPPQMLSSLGRLYNTKSSGLRSERPPDAGEAGLRGPFQGVLPNEDDLPAAGAEPAGDTAVAGHVGLALLVPERPAHLRARVALGAAVPEATPRKGVD